MLITCAAARRESSGARSEQARDREPGTGRRWRAALLARLLVYYSLVLYLNLFHEMEIGL